MRAMRDSTFVFVSSRGVDGLAVTDRRLLDVMAALLAEDAHVNLVCRPTSLLVDPARRLGVEVAPYRLDKVNLVRTRSRLRKYLRRYDPPVAHADGWIANVLLRLAAAPLPLKIVNGIECSTVEPPRAGFLGQADARLDARTLPRVDAFVAECAQAADALVQRGVPRERIEVIVPGTDVTRVLEEGAQPCTRPASKATAVVGYCGEPEDAGALDELLAAVDILRAEGREVVVAALPDASHGRLAERARDAGALRDAAAEELPALVACADVCAATATRPGAPAGLFVAGALGRPLVASAVDGACGLLAQNTEASYVSPGDVLGVADALRALLDDPGRGERMGERARHRVLDEYSAADAVKHHLDLYRRLMSA